MSAIPNATTHSTPPIQQDPLSKKEDQPDSSSKKISNIFQTAMNKLREMVHSLTMPMAEHPLKFLLGLVQIITAIVFAALLYLAALALLA